MGAADTLRQLIDAGKSHKRLDELSSARVIGKIALQVHAAQQKAGAGKAVGPITPHSITFAPSGEVTFTPTETSSLGYSSPEQLTGSGDRRSDVFSLGTVLWEILTYQRLFDAMNDAAVKIAVKERAITPPAEANANVPAELSAICMRALARNPADRYQSLKSMAVEIEEFLSEAGYEDNDEKIALYLEHMPRTLKVDTTPPLNRTAGGTQPPPVSSGAALAAALQSASSASTAVGVPAAPAPAELVPMPPVLPGQAAIRNDKSTIAVAVPPQVKVATAGAVVEAKHEPSKPHAVIVEDKRKAVIVEDKPKALIVEDNPKSTASGLGYETLREPAILGPTNGANGTPTVELKKPLEAPPVVAAVAKSDDAKPSANVKDTEPDGKTIEQKLAEAEARLDAKYAKPAEDKKPDEKAAKPDEKAAKPEEKKPEEKKDDKKKRTGPHPVAAVSLGPGPRESKADVLAGWGWGTDKHNAIAPDDYGGDDEDFHTPPDSKKTLLYVIGGGVAVAAMVTIIALVAGGSKDKKKPNKPVASAQTVEATQPAPPPAPAPPPDPAPAAGSGGEPQTAAAGSAAAGSAVDPAAEQAAAEQAAAEQAAADKAAADKAAADQAAADKAAAEQALLDKKAQEKLAAEQAAAEKKAAAEQAAADKKAAAEQRAADKKAAAEKLAADRKAAQEKAAAEKKTTTAVTTPKTTTAKTTTAAKSTTAAKTTTVAKTTTAKTESKVDVEAAYRQGIQQFARGDTAGALSSLRTSLAANPNYAPTWRGLGLVFEKMGETQQARAAFKRYLQLAPSATDSEQIKGRLERLGS